MTPTPCIWTRSEMKTLLRVLQGCGSLSVVNREL